MNEDQANTPVSTVSLSAPSSSNISLSKTPWEFMSMVGVDKLGTSVWDQGQKAIKE